MNTNPHKPSEGAVMPHSTEHNGGWRSPAVIATAMLILIIAFYVLREHWNHVVGVWPYLLLLLCPLMHVFMHRQHGAHHQ